jgi:predicted secreted hydrolase
VGLFAAAVVAAKPDQSYATDLAQKCQYEQLWWDMRSYAVTQLPTADENSFAEAINAFAKREADIMGSAAPTAPS